MLTRIAITFAVIAICLAEVRAELDASLYGYWPTGGGAITIAPIRGPAAIGGVEFDAEPGLLTFGGSAAPFAFRIPNSLNPGSVTLGVLGPLTINGATQLDITVSAAAGFGDVVLFDGSGLPNGIPIGPCGPDENCLAVILPIAAECDLNEDGLCNALDIDSLSSAIQSGDATLDFDLNQDGVVNDGDRNYWIESIHGTLSGDANLDGRVSFADFLTLSESFGDSGGWAQGDFDGDGQVEFTDFLVLSKNFGLPASMDVPLGISAVPEPSALGTTLLGLLACSSFVRKRRRDQKKRSC